MRCARLQLQERFKSKVKPELCPAVEKPRRYCQRRMVNPEHEEDPRWTDVYERFHCNSETGLNAIENSKGNSDTEDLFLTVQTLRFQGDVDKTKKSRTSFKYKMPTDGGQHRMFVKQAVDNEYSDDDRSSQLTCYYFDDYVKYLFNNDKSRPTSGKSSIFLQGLSDKREHKATQVGAEPTGGNKVSQKHDSKLKSLLKKNCKQDFKEEVSEDDADDTKITFRKSGKRTSLTISRTQSPETVQVIRVDVVCNYSNSSILSEYDDKKLDCHSNSDINIENIDMKGSHFTDKYLLTNTIKKLDENLSGTKVTLLCKTFQLTERAKTLATNKTKAHTDETVKSKESKKSHSKNKNSIRAKIRKQIHFM